MILAFCLGIVFANVSMVGRIVIGVIMVTLVYIKRSRFELVNKQ